MTVKVTNEFESMSLDEVTKAIDTMSAQVAEVFEKYRDGETGGVSYGEITAEDGDTIREKNAKLEQATKRHEKLAELAGIDSTIAKMNEFLKNPVRPMVFPNGPQRQERKSLGKRVHEEFVKTPEGAGRKQWSVEIDDAVYIVEHKGQKAVLGTDSALAGVGAEYPPENIRVGTFVETLYQPHNIAPLIPQVNTQMNAIPYMVETVTTEGASETAEGALGTEAVIDWAETLEPVRKIDVLQPITEELIADESGMRAIVDGRLRQFMGNREDLQLLTGNGTAPNIEGILNRTGLQNQNYSLTGETAQGLAEAALQAANLVRTAFQTPQEYVMQVNTWFTIMTAKDSQNNYLFPNAIAGGADPRLWGLPVRTNENMDADGTATNVPILVGDWSGAATIFRRQGVEVQVSDSHDDRFARGVLTIRMVERLALVVWRPAGFATVTRTA